MRILLIEDHATVRANMSEQLERAGHEVDVAVDGRSGLLLALAGAYDVLVLDLGLPHLDGLEVCRRLRAQRGAGPLVLMLTARDTLDDKLEGFAAGADDYLVKPFSPRTLVARVRAVLRRRSPQSLDDAVQMGPLKLDPATRRVTCLTGGVPTEIRLGPTEFRLLHYLLTHPERVHSRAQLLDRVWGDHVFIEERTVDVHIKRLRESLSVADCSGMVETVRGAGYRLAALPQVVAG